MISLRFAPGSVRCTPWRWAFDSNHRVPDQPSLLPDVSAPFPNWAGKDGFGLGYQVSVEQSVGGRSPGSLSWSGLQNTYFWIDLTNGIGVVLLLQLFPFNDDKVVNLVTTFECVLYSHLAGNDSVT